MRMDKLLKKKPWNYKHGSYKNPLYRTWHNMINRCHNEKHPDFPDYGRRGISVCDRWRNSFQSFADDMGPKPSPKHSIDRRETNGPYNPENCRWATPQEQGRNKRNNRLLTHNGETMPMSEWAERIGISLSSIHARLKLGWSVSEALDRPLGKHSSRRNF